MKVLLLAGGFGTRLSEETVTKPKPMVEVGGKPILWHIMKMYAAHGYKEFVVLLGYKGAYIKEYFADYYLQESDITVDLATNETTYHNTESEDWKVTLVDTGLHTMTGGRVKRAAKYINGEPFMLTYGDGVSDVNITELVKFHKAHGKLATMTSVLPEGRFGMLDIDDSNAITSFKEKPKSETGFINGGFFVCQPEVLDHIEDDTTIFERKPLERLAADKQLLAYKHSGFWQCMDSLKDKMNLEDEWASGAKWKIW